MKSFEWLVLPPEDGERIDMFLAGKDMDLSRRKIRRVIDVGGVYQNGKRVRVASRVVRSGDKVILRYSPEGLSAIKHAQFKLTAEDILYRKAGLIAINKPALLPSQATSELSGTHAIPLLEQYLKESGESPVKLFLLHRLDLDTSGILLIAEDQSISEFIMNGFREKTIHKTYLAACAGIPAHKTWEVQDRLSKIEKGFVRKVHRGGRSAHSKFELLHSDTAKNISLVKCTPFTGRSHQLRVHLNDSGIPILGDKRYGRGSEARLEDEIEQFAGKHHLLHAWKMSLFVSQESKDQSHLVAPLPAETFGALLRHLEWQVSS